MNLKSNLFLLFTWLSVITMTGQIGINTESPQKLFHVDGKGNTSGSTNISDDVVIDDNGNIGIGTLTPSTKLHIVSDGTTPALRIVDGKQGKGKVLASEQNGTIGWFQQSSMIRKLSPSKGQTIGGTAVVMEGSVLNVTESGDYLLVFSWWGRTAGMDALKKRTVNGLFRLWKNYGLSGASIIDEMEYYITISPAGASADRVFSLTIYFVAKDIKMGDTMSLLGSIGGGVTWSFGYSANKALMPSYTYIKISN